jgi:hypothetical protein
MEFGMLLGKSNETLRSQSYRIDETNVSFAQHIAIMYDEDDANEQISLVMPVNGVVLSK